MRVLNHSLLETRIRLGKIRKPHHRAGQSPQPTPPNPKIAKIPHQAWQEVSSFNAYKRSLKIKYCCLGFWIFPVVTIALFAIILFITLMFK